MTVYSHGRLDSGYGGPSMMTVDAGLLSAAWHDAGRVTRTWTPGESHERGWDPQTAAAEIVERSGARDTAGRLHTRVDLEVLAEEADSSLTSSGR
ncbi:Hypothetical protein RMHFA_05747 [Roseomonas mucosa]|uniref:hypothetical protein n=1 Tax=Roseomonas TaxID=125216 RepID=UPI000F80EE8A|nr:MULTISPECIES: hypothetical protein [Roseomonas]MBS5905465.1 hypothetical protein [Acetobacteraceae bacterium]HWL81664.1 hypothetical protein [Roseomonas sp.]MDT8291470.1 hypothetical protein [Roseomonas mucosa]MDT8312515.1 hypothetical protein [Roseomonas mucosa]MDT8352093.1 hypothetical protein [Roseomonas mucosa]